MDMSALPASTPVDKLLAQIADYASSHREWSQATLNTAGLCLTDAMACAIGSLDDPECARLLGPWFAEYTLDHGVPVPGTDYLLDPVKAAFDIGTTVRWLDFSDTTFAGGHASDNIGAILAAASHASAQRVRNGQPPLRMRDVFDAMIKAYEIQGRLAAANRFDHPSVGLDHVIYVKIASAAVAAHLLGADRDTILRALSNAWLDGQALNAYRHTPNAGTRKGWAGGDATSRGVWLAQLALRGEMGYPQPLSAATWGFEAVHLDGKPVTLDAPLGSFVMDNVIFKLYPCQRNATTAVESAARLRPWLDGRIGDIARITLTTQDEAMRRIDKTGPLPNRAARDHSLQYVVAVALLRGTLTSDDYSDEQAADPRIDWLRERMEVVEDPAYTRDHHDMAVLSCANGIRIELANGETSVLSQTQYPIGDPSRRGEATPMLSEKFHTLTAPRWSEARRSVLLERLLDNDRLAQTPIGEFMSWVAGG
jgi:2-methylcitrate dehydratase